MLIRNRCGGFRFEKKKNILREQINNIDTKTACFRLRHCTTSRKVEDSITDGVIGIFHWYIPGVDSPYNINEYQEYFLGSKCGRCVGLTTLPPSCSECLEIWETQPHGTLRASPGLYWDCFYCVIYGVYMSSNKAWRHTYVCHCIFITFHYFGTKIPKKVKFVGPKLSPT
jgi:hypothetical protein